MFLLGLLLLAREHFMCIKEGWTTYKRKTAVSACSNLSLVGVDEDAWVAVGTTAAVARDNSALCPSDGLLVNEFYGRIRLRLFALLVRSCDAHYQGWSGPIGG